MGLIGMLLDSVPSAPGSGWGPITSGGGTAGAAAAAGPPTCALPETPPEDHTPSPEPYTPMYPPTNWDDLPATTPPQPAPAEPDNSFFFPEEGLNSYFVKGQLDRYADWVNDSDSVGEKAAKAVPGLVIVPYGALLMCLENSLRSPLLG